MATLKEGMEGINKASTARTTSDFASDDYIQLFRTNGNEMAADYKISKSVLMDCIQSALGTLLNGGTAQTTGITKVPSLVGNALGATTVANLASVIGVAGTYPLNHPITGEYSISADQYLKISVRNSNIDSASVQNVGVGHANIILMASTSGFGYRRECVEITYPVISQKTRGMVYVDMLNVHTQYIDSIVFTRVSNDNQDFFGCIFIKVNSALTIRGRFDARDVAIKDSVDETALRTYTSFSIGRNELAI